MIAAAGGVADRVDEIDHTRRTTGVGLAAAGELASVS